MLPAFKKILTLSIFIFYLSFEAFSGTTGKIAGKVTDAETKEPLIGVNVVIVGQTLGAASDIDGEFYIINVPPGIYSVKVSMLGYNSRIVSNVRVQSDLTTKLNVDLQQTSVEIGEIVVTANRSAVQKDVTSSEKTMQADMIATLPARDVTSILSMQAGVTKDANGQIHIRGGRTTEISYMVDGVQIMNPLDRSSGIRVDDQSIEEIKAITGTFNAEYGQALSGVVNIVTKSGARKFSANATAFLGDHNSFDENVFRVMDNRDWAVSAARSISSGFSGFNPYYDYSKNGITNFQQLNDILNSSERPWFTEKPYLNTYNPFRNSDVQLNLSGPIELLPNISYFIAGRYQNKQGYQRGVRYFMPWGYDTPTKGDHQWDKPDGEMVSLDWYKGYSGQAKLFWDTDNLDISYGLFYTNDHSYGGGQKYVPDYGKEYFTQRYTNILSATYVASPSTFLEVKGTYYLSNHENYKYKDPYDYRYVPNDAGDFKSVTGLTVGYSNNDFGYWGNDLGRGENQAQYYALRADLSSQLNKYNFLKTGISATLNDLRDDSYTLSYNQTKEVMEIPLKTGPSFNHYAAKPKEMAAYIQNKIEYEELIINIGIRFDYFDADGNILSDPTDPQIYSPFKPLNLYNDLNHDGEIDPDTEQKDSNRRPLAELEKFWYKKSTPKYQFSPRIGLSFPITAEGVIHFSYGHFFQNPEFRYLFYNPNFWVDGANTEKLAGNADLKPEKTVMYELGLQQRMFEDLDLSVTGFYRDIRDWIGTGTSIQAYRGFYYTYVNKDQAIARGLTFSASQIIGNFNYSIDYTYMEVKGTSSDSRDAFNDLSAGRQPRVQMIDLNWSQPHSVNVLMGYNRDGYSGTVIGTINSGFPYTPSVAKTEDTGTYTGFTENTERKPTRVNIDIRLAKDINFEPVKAQFFVEVTNLFDIRNANNVYSDTGLPDVTFDAYTQKNNPVRISSTDEYFNNPGNYTAPRFIQFGVRLTY